MCVLLQVTGILGGEMLLEQNSRMERCTVPALVRVAVVTSDALRTKVYPGKAKRYALAANRSTPRRRRQCGASDGTSFRRGESMRKRTWLPYVRARSVAG